MITVLIIIVNVVAYIYSQSHPKFIDKYILSAEKIKRHKEWYRIITSGFLHGSPLHLIFNMYSFYSFGSYLEGDASGIFVGIIFLSTVVLGSLFSLYLHWGEWNYRALGASGGVMGVIFASILLQDSSIGLIFIPIFIPGYLFAVIFFFFSFLFGIRKDSKIGHDAHVGGAVGGCIGASIIYGMNFDLNGIMLCVFSFLAISIWIWHERGIKNAVISLLIGVSLLGLLSVQNGWLGQREVEIKKYNEAKVIDYEKNILGEYISDTDFLSLLKYSLSLEKAVKIRIISEFRDMEKEKVNELREILISEKESFKYLHSKNEPIYELVKEKQYEWEDIILCFEKKECPTSISSVAP